MWILWANRFANRSSSSGDWFSNKKFAYKSTSDPRRALKWNRDKKINLIGNSPNPMVTHPNSSPSLWRKDQNANLFLIDFSSSSFSNNYIFVLSKSPQTSGQSVTHSLTTELPINWTWKVSLLPVISRESLSISATFYEYKLFLWSIGCLLLLFYCPPRWSCLVTTTRRTTCIASTNSNCCVS